MPADGLIVFGFRPSQTAGAPSGVTQSADTHKVAFSFYLPTAAMVSKIRLFQGAGGTSVGMVWSILADDAEGKPGTVEVAETSFTTTGQGTMTELTINNALTAGKHWLVLRNTTATSVTYYFASSAWATLPPTHWGKRQDLGLGHWDTGVIDAVSGLTVELATGEVLGLCPSSGSSSGDSTYLMYTGFEAGVAFQSPSNIYLNASAVTLYSYQSGTSGHGNIFARLYVNGSLAAESPQTPVINSGGGGYRQHLMQMSRNVVIPPDSDVRITASLTGGSSSVYLRAVGMIIDTNNDDSRWLKLRPCSGTFRAAKFNSGVWSYNESRLPFMGLLLDRDEPFYAPPINRRTSTGR